MVPVSASVSAGDTSVDMSGCVGSIAMPAIRVEPRDAFRFGRHRAFRLLGVTVKEFTVDEGCVLGPVAYLPNASSAPAVLPTPLQCEIARAHALRRANELSFHLGEQPEGEILIWLPNVVHVLPVVDIEPHAEADGARFLQIHHDPDDVQVLDRRRALLLSSQQGQSHMHFGPMKPSHGCCAQLKDGAGLPAPVQGGCKYTLIEFCCSPTSVLCDERQSGPTYRGSRYDF